MNPPLKFVAPRLPLTTLAPGNADIGFEFYSTVVKPYFEKPREKEEEAGGSGRDARKKKSEFLQRVSITIAKKTSRVTPESSARSRLYAPRLGLAICHRTRLGH
jgi:hypothetical protein